MIQWTTTSFYIKCSLYRKHLSWISTILLLNSYHLNLSSIPPHCLLEYCKSLKSIALPSFYLITTLQISLIDRQLCLLLLMSLIIYKPLPFWFITDFISVKYFDSIYTKWSASWFCDTDLCFLASLTIRASTSSLRVPKMAYMNLLSGNWLSE